MLSDLVRPAEPTTAIYKQTASLFERLLGRVSSDVPSWTWLKDEVKLDIMKFNSNIITLVAMVFFVNVDLLEPRFEPEIADAIITETLPGTRTLCGFIKGVRTTEMNGEEYGVAGALLMAWDIKNGSKHTTLMSIDLGNNNLTLGKPKKGFNGDETEFHDLNLTGILALADAIKSSSSLESVDLLNNNVGGMIEAGWVMTPGNEKEDEQVEFDDHTWTCTRVALDGFKFLVRHDLSGIMALAQALSTSNSMKKINLLLNNLNDEAYDAIVSVAQEKEISLCGFDESITEADLSSQNLKLNDVRLIARENDLVSSLESIDLSENGLGPEGATVLAPAIGLSTSLTSINLAKNGLCGIFGQHFQLWGTLEETGIQAITEAVASSSSLTSIK